MVPTEFHFRVERKMVSVFLQWLHVITEYVVRAIGLRQDIRKKTIAHADAEETFDIRFSLGRLLSPEALQSRQKECAASGFKNVTTFHIDRLLIV